MWTMAVWCGGRRTSPVIIIVIITLLEKRMRDSKGQCCWSETSFAFTCMRENRKQGKAASTDVVF